MDEIQARARDVLERLRYVNVDLLAAELMSDVDAPELMQAVVEILRRESEPSHSRISDVSRAYELVTRLDWPDEFDEKEELLSRLAFSAWNLGRLLNHYPTTRLWEARCATRTLRQRHVEDFFGIAVVDRSGALADRFLADEAVVLACCHRLAQERNRIPSEVVVEGEWLYRWLTTSVIHGEKSKELRHYFAAHVSISLLCAKQHVNHVTYETAWHERIQTHLERATGAASLAAQYEHLCLANLFISFESDGKTAEACKALIARLEALEMEDYLVRTRFLLGEVLREVGEFETAMGILLHVLEDAKKWNDRIVESSCLAGIAQVLGQQGRFAEGVLAGTEAVKVARAMECEWAIAGAQAAVGELLRDHGNLDASIEAYTASIRSYEEAGMAGRASYVRVFLAETLLMAGRPSEAATEIVQALPDIERKNLPREALTALAILREAIHRQQTDPVALRQLREQLDLMRRERKL